MIMGLCLFLTVALMFPTPVSAQGITVEDTVEEGEVVDHNLVLSGPVVVMDGTVEGDLAAFGDKITINGEVDGDLVVIGNQVVLNGSVSDSVYIGAATLVIGPDASVGRDISFIGGMFDANETSSVARDLNLITLDANLSGSTGRDVNALVGPMRLGLVIYQFMQDQGWLPQTRQLDLQLSRAGLARQAGLAMGFGLSSIQNFVPVSAAPVHAPGQQTEIDAEAWQVWGVSLLRNIGALLIVGLLAVWLLPGQLYWTSEQPRRRPWRSFFVGLLIATLGWIIAVLALLLVLGIAFFLYWIFLPNLGFLVGSLGLLAIGLAMVVYWLSIAFFSKVVVAYLVGRLIFNRLLPKYAQSRVGPLVTGVVLYALLASIPYLGWVIATITTFIGLGALWVVATSRGMEEIEPVTVVPPAEEHLGVA